MESSFQLVTPKLHATAEKLFVACSLSSRETIALFLPAVAFRNCCSSEDSEAALFDVRRYLTDV